jgi:hypothetical protein
VARSTNSSYSAHWNSVPIAYAPVQSLTEAIKQIHHTVMEFFGRLSDLIGPRQAKTDQSILCSDGWILYLLSDSALSAFIF